MALSYALAVLIPIVGAVLGVLLLVRRSVGHGIAVIAISAAMLVLVLVIDPPSGSGGGDETSVEDRVSRITDRAMTCVRHHNYRHINECLK